MQKVTKTSWAPIPGYEGLYEASSLGKIRSLNRVVISTLGIARRFEGRVLRPTLNKNSKYPTVTLHKKGKQKRYLVHRLVMHTFVGPCPLGMEVCHNDGNRINSQLKNLRYDTRKGNEADKRRHGTAIVGEKHSNSKLKENEAKQILKLYASGNYTFQQIADRFGVAETTARDIVRGRKWKHLDRDVEALQRIDRRLRLTEDTVRSIRREHLKGTEQRKLAKKDKVSEATVSRVVTWKAWEHVKD